MKKIILALSVVTVLLATGFSYLAYKISRLDKIVVVDVVRVFNEFNMKKDMEKKTEGRLREYTQRIDSLDALYKAVLTKPDTTGSGYLKGTLENTRSNAAQFYEISNKQINEQVWNRLNPLLDEYGKEHNIRILIGANGMGSVLYRDTTADKTTEVIDYVNRKYENLN